MKYEKGTKLLVKLVDGRELIGIVNATDEEYLELNIGTKFVHMRWNTIVKTKVI